MAKTVETILQELSINSSSTVEEISNKIDEYILVTKDEILGIKNISVQPLPTIVKNNEANLKQRMIGIVTDEERGTVALLNKRIVLLTRLINAIKAELETEANSKEQSLLGKIEQAKAEATASVNSLKSQLTSRISVLEIEVTTKASKQHVDDVDNQLIAQIEELNRVKAELNYVNNLYSELDDNCADLASEKADRTELNEIKSRVTTVENKKADTSYVDGKNAVLNTRVSSVENNKVNNVYLTENYYSKAVIDSMISSLTRLTLKKVDTLPSTAESNVIYLVQSGDEQENLYKEYLYVEGSWEMIGSTQANLDEYVKDNEIVIQNEGSTSKTVGGISAGTVLKGKTVLEVLEDILYPYVAFSLNVDSIIPSTNVYEKGTSATITSVTVKITNGSRNITNLKLYDGSSKTTLLGEKTSGISTSNTFTINKTVGSSVSFYAEATDGVSTIGDSTSFLSFYYPTFYGSLNAGYTLTSDLITNKAKSLKSSKTNTFTFTATNQHPFVAFPASYGNLTSIKDSSNLEYIGDFTKTTMNLTVTGGTVSYNIYVLKDPTDISDYKFIFS